MKSRTLLDSFRPYLISVCSLTILYGFILYFNHENESESDQASRQIQALQEGRASDSVLIASLNSRVDSLKRSAPPVQPHVSVTSPSGTQMGGAEEPQPTVGDMPPTTTIPQKETIKPKPVTNTRHQGRGAKPNGRNPKPEANSVGRAGGGNGQAVPANVPNKGEEPVKPENGNGEKQAPPTNTDSKTPDVNQQSQMGPPAPNKTPTNESGSSPAPKAESGDAAKTPSEPKKQEF